MGYGLLILFDLMVRSTALTAHYSDQGVLPRTLLFKIGHDYDLCVHALGGSTLFLALLFVFNGAAAAALLIGWRTRAATLVCWLMMASLHNRNFALQNGGDNWMCLTLFWALFLPWGERWSVDSWSLPKRDNEVAPTPGTWGLAYQIFVVYWFAGIFKTGPTWWVDHTAIQFSLQLNQWTGKYAYLPLMFPDLLKGMTFFILLYELIGPFLFFSLWRTGPVRTLIVLGFMSFHLGLGIFLELGFFPWVGLVSVSALLPSWAWKRPPWTWLANRMDRLWRSLETRFGKRLRGSSRPLRLSRPEQWLLTFVCVYITLWCTATLTKRVWLPPQARIPGYFFALDQYWALFAPDTPDEHGWLVAEGVLEDGSSVDLFWGGPPRWEGPTSSSEYPNQRWKRLTVTVAIDSGAPLRETFLRYLARRYRSLNPDTPKIVQGRLYWVSQPSTVNFEEAPTGKLHLLDLESP